MPAMEAGAPAPEKKRSKAPLLIGCGVVLLLLLLCAGGAGFFGVRLFRAGVEQMQQDEQFAQAWTPPAADAPSATFAPRSVGGFELARSDQEAAFPALGLQGEGAHAVYERGGETVEVSVYRMNETEKSAAFEEIERRISDGDRFPNRSQVRLPRSYRFSISPPELNGMLWHGGGWLVFVRSATNSELAEFLRAYLEAVGGEVEGESVEAERETPAEVPEPTADDEASAE